MDKWIRTTVTVVTKASKRHHLTNVLVAFVSRSTDVLILGQHECKASGYKTIEDQDSADDSDMDPATPGRDASSGGGTPNGTANPNDSASDTDVSSGGGTPAGGTNPTGSSRHATYNAHELSAQHSVRDVSQRTVDGLMYAGQHAIDQIDSCVFVARPGIKHSYITTAALQRSGCIDDADPPDQVPHPDAHQLQAHDPALHDWLCSGPNPDNTKLKHCEFVIDRGKILQPQETPLQIKRIHFIVIPSDHMRIVLGDDALRAIDSRRDADPSPLQHTPTPADVRAEIQDALEQLDADMASSQFITAATREAVRAMLHDTYRRLWKTKYDLQRPASVPPMHIKLKPGAEPRQVRRSYRWTEEQYKFMEDHLAKLLRVGIISRADTPWCCPVVLVLKPDLTWRLCVDPAHLNKSTVPMQWEIPKVREELQQRLAGSNFFCTFDFVSMFWQLPLHPDSRDLFAFYAGRLGTYKFNRVAMGALNSSCWTQKVVSQLFANAGLLRKGLEILTDDVLLHAATQEQLVLLLDKFLTVCVQHNLAVHPGKIKLFKQAVIYCGLHISSNGISVDPDRIQALTQMSPPLTVGDVWQFTAASGWIRGQIPNFAHIERPLNELITTSLQMSKKRDMKAAQRIKLKDTSWDGTHQRAWDQLKAAVKESITTAYRDRRKRACLFSDASQTGWSYVVTQCDPDELEKPWAEQQHRILAACSGTFQGAQLRWNMSCKEAYPIRIAAEAQRHLLYGDLPWASINDHKSLMYIFNADERPAIVHSATHDRLNRWAAWLRTSHFRTYHIPGADNHLCDLLSRHGASTAAKICSCDHTHAPTAKQPVAQHMIVVPKPQPASKRKTRSMSRLLHLNNPHNILWPTTSTIAASQQKYLDASQMQRTRLVQGKTLAVDKDNRVIIPDADKELIEAIITIAHQADHYHRSQHDTEKCIAAVFAIHKLRDTVQRAVRACISCLKSRYGQMIPRPLWYMVRATRPFEYLHADFVHVPLSTCGCEYVLVIVDDLSLTALLHPCKRNDAKSFITAMLDHWLAYYPDPIMLQTDGGTHFDNKVVRGLASRRGWQFRLTTPYCKWAHGVAERLNKQFLAVIRPLCRATDTPVNKWPKILKLAQAALNRLPRKSRGGLSPLQLTTSMESPPALHQILQDADITTVNTAQVQIINEHVQLAADVLQEHWDLADTARRATNASNAKKTDLSLLEDLRIGDYVLFAQHKPATKFDYTWAGPAVIVDQVNDQIYTLQHANAHDHPHRRADPFDVHVSHIRLFAPPSLGLTATIRHEIVWDNPNNIISKIVSHRFQRKQLWLRIRWRGFTAEADTYQDPQVVANDAPDVLVRYLRYMKRNKIKWPLPLKRLQQRQFPSFCDESR